MARGADGAGEVDLADARRASDTPDAAPGGPAGGSDAPTEPPDPEAASGTNPPAPDSAEERAPEDDTTVVTETPDPTQLAGARELDTRGGRGDSESTTVVEPSTIEPTVEPPPEPAVASTPPPNPDPAPEEPTPAAAATDENEAAQMAPPPAATPRFTPTPYEPGLAPGPPPPPPPPLPPPPDDAAPVAATPPSPAVQHTGAVPILEIKGGWEAVYRRRRRQTLTFLGGLAAVILVGIVAWLTYAGVLPWPFGGQVDVSQSACTYSKPLPPKKITIRVYNGSSRTGLAGQVSGQLKAFGFVVKGTGNDPLEARITTAVELRHGVNGVVAAKTMSAYVNGKVDDVQDDRQDQTVDVVLGPKFSRVNTRREVNRALDALAGQMPQTCPFGVTPSPTGAPTPAASGASRPKASPTR